MKSLVLELPVIDEIMSKLAVMDSKLESLQNAKPLVGLWLNTKEAAQALGITTRTLQTYRDQGLIPFSQFGREIRYQAEDIQAFLMAHYVKPKNWEGGIS